MPQDQQMTLDEFIQNFFKLLPKFENLNCFLRGLDFQRFLITNIPQRNFRVTFCGSLDQLHNATELHKIKLIRELNINSEPIFLYGIDTAEWYLELEHFRTIESLENFLDLRPLYFQKSLYSLRLREEIGNPENNSSIDLTSLGAVDKLPEDLIDLMVVCLCKQKVPSQILGAELMPQISASSEALNLLLGDWIFNHRVGALIDDLNHFGCLPSSCEGWLVKSLPGIRWFEQNQIAIEELFTECFPTEKLERCKALFYLCVSHHKGINTLKWNENEVFSMAIHETRDWWLSRLQGEKLNPGLVESWIQKFLNQYQLAVFCSCLMSAINHRQSVWFDLATCFSRIIEIISEMNQEEKHVCSEIRRYSNEQVDRNLEIKAVIASWGGRLRTRKQWQSFLGLN
tara:strand:+ start:2624 stop:3823 length:1200 start_codon:yes stop_codon:yes gene_type:complete